MKKIAIILVTLILLLTGCAENNTNTEGPTATQTATQAVKVSVHDALKKILEETKLEEPVTLETEGVAELYEINTEDVADSACVITMNGIFPDEVILIEAVDTAAAQRIKDKLQLHIDEVKIQAQDYDAESYALACECKVTVNGTNIAMIVSAQHEAMEKTYSSLMGE